MIRIGAVILVAAAVAAGLGQIPPGYEVIQLTSGPEFDRAASINNRGQIVFSQRVDPNDEETGEIYLYENGQLTRLTDDYIRDDYPDINDDGVITWSRGVGGGGPLNYLEIVVLRDGQLTRLTNDAVSDYSPRINSLSHITWYRWVRGGCADSNSHILFFDGESTQVITADGYSNVIASINDHDEIAWSRRNFCDQPWSSEIYLYSGGVTTQLSLVGEFADGPAINNHSQVAWTDRGEPQRAINIWENGQVRPLTDWGMNVRLNNRGDAYFIRWYESDRNYQAWLYRGGTFFQLSNDPFWNTDGDINDFGEVAWSSRNYPVADIRYLRRYATGDMNCDGRANNLDIDPFVAALAEPDVYFSRFPGCDRMLADTNQDEFVNNFDIEPFVALLTP